MTTDTADDGPLLDIMSVAASNYSLSLPAASFGSQLIYSHRMGLARAILAALTAQGFIVLRSLETRKDGKP